LKEIHTALIGNPLDPNAPPGVVTMVRHHETTLYGKTGKNGLVGDNMRYKKLVWVGIGILTAFVVLGKLLDWLVAMKSAGR
jgi:hypothetical protein